TGSVSTMIRSAVRLATRMVSRHGSAATCCTTRFTSVPPVDATNCAAPALAAELLLIHATPALLVTVFFDSVAPTDKLKFTDAGSTTKLLYLSKTKATPLITFGRDTGTRDGGARKLRFSALPGFTQKTCDCSPEMATHLPALRSSSPLISTLPDF